MATPSWDLTDQDCDALDGGWSSGTGGSGSYSQVTYDSRSCYRLQTTASASDWASVAKANSAWTGCSLEVTFRGVSTDYTYCLQMEVRDASKYRYGCNYAYANNTGQIYIWAGDTGSAYGTYNLQANWNKLRLVVNASTQKIWVFFNGMYINTKTLSGVAGALDAYSCAVSLYGNAGGAYDHYIDHISMSSSKSESDNGASMKIYDQDINCVPAGTDQELRFRTDVDHSGPVTHSFNLVSTSDAFASHVYFYDGSTTRALQRFPISTDF